MLHGQPRRQSLQLGADVLDGDGVLERDAGDEGAPVGQAGQQAFALQRADRLAHRLPADPEPSGQINFEDALARLESAIEDLVAQRVGNIVAQRAAASQSALSIISFDTTSPKLYTRLHPAAQNRPPGDTEHLHDLAHDSTSPRDGHGDDPHRS